LRDQIKLRVRRGNAGRFRHAPFKRRARLANASVTKRAKQTVKKKLCLTFLIATQSRGVADEIFQAVPQFGRVHSVRLYRGGRCSRRQWRSRCAVGLAEQPGRKEHLPSA